MNASIVYKSHVEDVALDMLAEKLPAAIAAILEVPGGNLAKVKPEQISLIFSQASTRDVGSDVRVMIFARKNDPRISTENDRARGLHEKVVDLISTCNENYSVDIRLYLMEIGAS